MTYFDPQRPKCTGSWRGRPSAGPCTSPRRPERADQTVSPPDLWPCRSWSYGAAREQTNVPECSTRQLIGRRVIPQETTSRIRVQRVWNNICALQIKYFSLLKHAISQTGGGAEEAADLRLIFIAFMFIGLSVRRACWWACDLWCTASPRALIS